MTAKSLDVYVLAKLILEKERRPFSVLAKELGMSASELHASVGRLIYAGLIEEGRWKIRVMAVEEFLFHGVPFVFPARREPDAVLGIPTAYAAAPLNSLLSFSSTALVPVWAYSEGSKMGNAIKPLHPSAPKVAGSYPAFYEVLALIDAIRDGKARDRQIASEELHKRITKK